MTQTSRALSGQSATDLPGQVRAGPLEPEHQLSSVKAFPPRGWPQTEFMLVNNAEASLHCHGGETFIFFKDHLNKYYTESNVENVMLLSQKG